MLTVHCSDMKWQQLLLCENGATHIALQQEWMLIEAFMSCKVCRPNARANPVQQLKESDKPSQSNVQGRKQLKLTGTRHWRRQ